MPVTKKRTDVMPQLVQPIKRRLERSSTIVLVVSGICGTIAFVLLGILYPSDVAIFAALAGFFAGFTSTAVFRTQETQDEILDHRRKIASPLVHRSRALLQCRHSNADDFRERFAKFQEVEDSEHFAFLSDDLQGMYLDCVEEGVKHFKLLTGELEVRVIPNDFGITAGSIDEQKDITFYPLEMLLRRLIDDCRREAKMTAPMRTMRVGQERTRKIGRFVLYRKYEETSAD